MTTPTTRKQSTIIALRHPFPCRTKSGFAHRIALRVPTGVGALDTLSNFCTVAKVCGRASADLMRFCRDQITDRPARAAVIDEDNSDNLIPLDDTMWSAIQYSNGGDAAQHILEAYTALVVG